MYKAYMPCHHTNPGLIHAFINLLLRCTIYFFIHFVLQTSGKQKLLNKKKHLFNSNNNYNSNNNN